MACIFRFVILFWIDQEHVYVLLTRVCTKHGTYKGLGSKLLANCLAWAGASKSHLQLQSGATC